MRRLSIVITILAAAALASAAMHSCAKAEPEDTSYLEQLSLDAWVKKYVGLDRAAKQPNGMWVEVIDEGSQDPDATPIGDTIVWVRMNYTGRTLQNDIFVTRNVEEAKQQNTYTPYTHYIPDYIFCSNTNLGMMAGQYYALKNKLTTADGSTLELREGSRVRLYIPSKLAFGSNGYSDDQGYGGQYSLSAKTKPVIEDLEIVEVVKNPVEREEKLVTEHALNEWGMTEADTTAAFFYLDTLNFRADLSAPFEASQKLTVDSTAKIWFVGRFLDGFIFDTNIDSIQWRVFGETRDTAVKSYKPETDKDSDLPAFYTAIPAMRRGQWGRVLFTSAYGYGVQGLSSALIKETEYYNTYINYMFSSSYYNTGSYGTNYYDSYYNNYYYGNYYDTSSSSEDEIVTEVQAYTPLILEIYIEE